MARLRSTCGRALGAFRFPGLDISFECEMTSNMRFNFRMRVWTDIFLLWFWAINFLKSMFLNQFFFHSPGP